MNTDDKLAFFRDGNQDADGQESMLEAEEELWPGAEIEEIVD